jgi:CRP-like cAMP-binding protein
MHDTPRTATVICSTECVLLSITKEKFSKFLHVAPELGESFHALLNQRMGKELKRYALFAHLSNKKGKAWCAIDMLGSLFVFEQYSAGSLIYSQGARLKRKFFLISLGTVQVKLPSGATVHLEHGCHFGERAILSRAQDDEARAVTDTVVLVVDEHQFITCLTLAPELIVYFQRVLQERNAGKYEQPDLVLTKAFIAQMSAAPKQSPATAFGLDSFAAEDEDTEKKDEETADVGLARSGDAVAQHAGELSASDTAV